MRVAAISVTTSGRVAAVERTAARAGHVADGAVADRLVEGVLAVDQLGRAR